MIELEEIADDVFRVRDDDFGRYLVSDNAYQTGSVLVRSGKPTLPDARTWHYSWEYWSRGGDHGYAPTREHAIAGMYMAMQVRTRDVRMYKCDMRFRVNLPIDPNQPYLIEREENLRYVMRRMVAWGLTKSPIPMLLGYWMATGTLTAPVYTKTLFGARWVRFWHRARKATITEFNQAGGTYATEGILIGIGAPVPLSANPEPNG